MKRLLPAMLVAALCLLAAPVGAFEPLYDNLNEIERRNVDRVLDDLGLTRVEDPHGRVFGEVIVVPLEVFGEDVDWLSWANLFHATTRPHIVEDEVLWERGDPFDTEIVEETVRNLRASVNLSVVAMVPVEPRGESAEEGVVDIVAVTKDTWSLRLNSEFDIADGVVNEIFISLTERNLAGLHKQVALVGIYEQDTFSIGPRYLDPRLFRSRLNLKEQLLFAINHDTGELEGTEHVFEFGLPLYSLDRDWGFSLSERHTILVNRLFVGDQVRTWDDPDTVEIEAVPFELDSTSIDVRAIARRGFGRTPRHVVSFGYGLSIDDFDLADEVRASESVDPELAERFEAANLPRDETSSFLIGAYRFFAAEFETVRNYQTYGFAEDLQVGFDVGGEVLIGPRFLGSDNDFFTWSMFAGYQAVVPRGEGPGAQLDGAVLSAEVELGARYEIEPAVWIDQFLSVEARAASPQWGPVRLHVGAETFVKRDRVTTGLVELGGSNGLRGFSSGAFLGESYALGHIELRTLSFELLSLRIGGLVFFDAGTVWSEVDDGIDPELLSDVGLGLRIVAPQTQTFVYRVDYAFPTSGPRDFFPGTLTIGVEQVF